MATTAELEKKKGKLGKWTPKKWRQEYDRVVGYSAMGKPNTEIAVMMGYTPEHVSTILNLPPAQELLAKLQSAMRERMLTNIPDTLEYVARKTADRLKQVVDSDDLFEKSPFAVIKAGTEILKGLNHLKGGGNGAPAINVNGNALIVPAAQAESLFGGLSKADEARKLNAAPVKVIEREG